MDPNFFIIGAAKCGTSALSAYLSEHPEIYFSVPKETNFWCTDYAGLRDLARIESLDQYRNLFAAARPEHRALGEGSVNYFRSAVAVANIRQFNPDARFILMLRNPVDMVYSMHQERLFQFYDDVKDFETAWNLQDERLEGRHIPPRCVQPELLQYGRMGRYADRLEEFLREVPEQQRRVILFDDFVERTRETYQGVLDFLGVKDDGRTDFPRVRESHRHRFGALSYFLLRPPGPIRRPVLAMKRMVQRNAGGMWNAIRPLLVAKNPRSPLRPEFKSCLSSYFAADVARTSELLDRDLSHWTQRDLVTAS